MVAVVMAGRWLVGVWRFGEAALGSALLGLSKGGLQMQSTGLGWKRWEGVE